METIVFSFNTVTPILLTVFLGMLLRKCSLINESTIQGVNKLCYNLLIPLNIFNSLYTSDFRSATDWRFIGFGVLFILVTLLLLCLITPQLFHDKVNCGEFIQGVFRGNVSLISISLLTNLYGNEGIRVMSLLFPLTLILYNGLSTIELSFFINRGKDLRIIPLIVSVMKNPLIIASILGVLFAVFSPFKMPEAIGSTIRSVSAAGTPMALMTLGAATSLRGDGKNVRLALLAAALRQFLIPIIVLGAAVLLGFRDAQLGAYLCIVCTPTATVGYVLARNSGGTGKLAAQIIIFSTVFSFISMFAAIAILKHFAML